MGMGLFAKFYNPIVIIVTLDDKYTYWLKRNVPKHDWDIYINGLSQQLGYEFRNEEDVLAFKLAFGLHDTDKNYTGQ